MVRLVFLAKRARKAAKPLPAANFRRASNIFYGQEVSQAAASRAVAAAPDRASLGRVIRRLRQERNLSIETLAGAARMHPTYLSGIERGLRNPTWRSIGRVCDALNVKVSELAALAESLDA